MQHRPNIFMALDTCVEGKENSELALILVTYDFAILSKYSEGGAITQPFKNRPIQGAGGTTA
jgi:hypothetical protein